MYLEILSFCPLGSQKKIYAYYNIATNLDKILFYTLIISILLESPTDFLNNYYPLNL